MQLPLEFSDGSSSPGLVYIADEKNAAYLGPATEPVIARHIAKASGPSGTNRAYLLQLADALRSLGKHDDHVFAIEHYLRQAEAS